MRFRWVVPHTVWQAIERFAVLLGALGGALIATDSVQATEHAPKGYLLGLGITFIVGAVVLGAVGIVGEQVHRHRAEQMPNDGTIVAESSLSLLVVTPLPNVSYAALTLEARPRVPSMIEVHGLAYAALPSNADPVTLIYARGDVQLDDGPTEHCESRIGQHLLHPNVIPDDYEWPPVVRPGSTVEIEWSFHVRAPASVDIVGAVVQPRWARVLGLVLVDQLQRPYEVGDMDHGPVVNMSKKGG